MDLRLSKRAPTDDLLELYNLSESPELEKDEDMLYESPALEKRDNMLRLSKRDLLRLSKRDLLRLSKRDLLRLSKRDLLRLSKRSEEARQVKITFFDFPSQDSNRDLRLSKRPEWSEVDWQPPLLDKKDQSEVRIFQPPTYPLEDTCEGADDNPTLKERPESPPERGFVGSWSWKRTATLQTSL